MDKKEKAKESKYSPGLAGIPACYSQISYIDGKKGILEYRGIPIEKLAKNSTFEETSYLLLKGTLPDAAQLNEFTWDLRRQRRLRPEVIELIKCLPERGHAMGALETATSAIGMFYSGTNVTSKDENWHSIMRLIAKTPTIIAAFHRIRAKEEPILPDDDLDHASNFLYMLKGKKPSKNEAKLFDACLILHADHTLNASTFSARVTASTLADPYTVVCSAIGTLTGPLHGGANERVMEMLQKIGDLGRVGEWMNEKIINKKKIMGLGHRVYKTKDPRAEILQKLAKGLFPDSKKKNDVLAIAEEIERIAKKRLASKGVYPNVDFYSGLVYRRLGIPNDLFTPIFALARISGWLAHWLEQLEDNRIYRPTQIYTGDRKEPYSAIDRR